MSSINCKQSPDLFRIIDYNTSPQLPLNTCVIKFNMRYILRGVFGYDLIQFSCTIVFLFDANFKCLRNPWLITPSFPGNSYQGEGLLVYSIYYGKEFVIPIIFCNWEGCFPVFWFHKLYERTTVSLSNNLAIGRSETQLYFSNFNDKKEGRWSLMSQYNKPHNLFKIFALCDFFMKIWSIQVVDNWVILDGNVIYG